jgi:hypothetical protein
MAYHQSNSPVLRTLFAPVQEVYFGSLKRYDCPEFSDLDFLEAGTLRCLSDTQSGRGFLQLHGDHGRKDVPVDLFFKALKSKVSVKPSAS